MTPAASNRMRTAGRMQQLRRRIEILSHQLTSLYRSASQERKELHEIEWGKPEEFSVLSALSDFGDTIAGYACSIVQRGARKHPEQALRKLARLGPFNDPRIMRWVGDHEEDFPLICQYFEALDHLRVLVIDYLATPQPRLLRLVRGRPRALPTSRPVATTLR